MASNPVVRSILAFTFVCLVAPAAARAQPTPPTAPPRDAEHARLGLFTTTERAILAPHLDRGPVALVEFNTHAELPAVILAARIEAPAHRVAELIADPTGYPAFMPALDSVSVTSRRHGITSYDWTWRTAIFTLTGSNVMHVYPPRHRRDRPYRIESTATTGDLGEGRLVWRVYPDGPRRSLLVLSSRMDLRDANYVTRQLNRGQRSINRTINISLAFVMALGTKREIERRMGTHRAAPPDAAPLERPEVDIRALAHLLIRGDLLMMDMTGDRLDQVAVVGRTGRTLERTREVLTDPREFGPALVPGSYARITREEGPELDFEWGVSLPLIGTSGTMQLRDTGSTVEIDATEGAFEGGRWRFDTEVYPWGEAVVVGWARFDPGSASWLIRMIVESDSDFGHGLAGGSEVMVMRAIRSRAWRVHEARAEAEARRQKDG